MDDKDYTADVRGPGAVPTSELDAARRIIQERDAAAYLAVVDRGIRSIPYGMNPRAVKRSLMPDDMPDFEWQTGRFKNKK